MPQISLKQYYNSHLLLKEAMSINAFSSLSRGERINHLRELGFNKTYSNKIHDHVIAHPNSHKDTLDLTRTFSSPEFKQQDSMLGKALTAGALATGIGALSLSSQ